MPDSDNKASLLIVDDNSKNLQILAEMLRNHCYRVATAKNGTKALSFVHKRKPDLLLLDVMMPELDGFEVCRQLKESEQTQNIPIIFISALSDTEAKVKGFALGGVDYITKPFEREEVLARVNTHIELKRSREALSEACQQLYKINLELERAVRTDTLTRLSNRRDIIEKIQNEINRSLSGDQTFCLIIGDIDDFKHFNDQFGHDCGDDVLVKVSSLIRSSTRQQDVVSRWGGEEFLLMLPQTDIKGAIAMANKLLEKLNQLEFQYQNLPLNVTMTFGVSSYQPGMSIDQCIKNADQALMIGKRSGKNCVISNQ